MTGTVVGIPGETSARRTERALLLLAVAVSAGAHGLLELSRPSGEALPVLAYGGVIALLATVAHLAMRWLAPDADPLLLPLAVLLNGIGLVFVRRIDLANGTELALAQATWTVVGLAALLLTLVAVRDYRRMARYQYTAGLVTIALLVLPLLPLIGREVNGARLWVRVAGMSMQPGELAKLTLVVFLAGYLERKRALLSVATQRLGPLLLPAPRHIGPVLAAATAALAVMVAQRDLGTSLLFLGVFVVLLYVATGRLAYPALGLLTFAVGAVLAYQVFPHVQRRVDVWLDPWPHVQDAGYQLSQALFALGSGGLAGTGLGYGQPDSIPFAATDAIFAVVGEELGLLGASALLVAYVLLTARGFKAALTARDEVGTLLAAGLTTIVALQVFVVVGGITRLVPFTGITLPFLAYGGSSLVSNYILVALLARISHESSRAARAGPRPAAVTGDPTAGTGRTGPVRPAPGTGSGWGAAPSLPAPTPPEGRA